MPTRPPAVSRRQNLVMGCCAMVGFSSLYLTQSLGPALQRLQGVSVPASGGLLMGTTLGLAFSSPMAGLLGQRFGLRHSLLLGLAALGVLDAALAFASGYASLLGLRVAQGVAMPLVLSALLTSIERQPDEDASLRIAASYVMGILCGGTLGRLLPALVIDRLGWKAAFLAMAVLHVGALAVAVRGFRPPASRPRLARPASAAQERAGPSLTWVCACGFGLLFSQVAVFTYVTFRLAAPPFGWSTAALGSLYLVFLPALAFVRQSRRVVAGWGHGRALAAAVVAAWGSLAWTLPDQGACILLGLAGFSVTVFFAQAVLAHALSICACRSRAQASGRYLCCYYLGGSLGAVLPALAWQRSGWAACLALVALVQAVLAIAARVWRPAPAVAARHPSTPA